MISQEILTALTHVLQHVASSDNDLRMAAERELNTTWLIQRPQDFLLGLVTLLRSHDDPNVNKRQNREKWFTI
jgi:hypothetical protein